MQHKDGIRLAANKASVLNARTGKIGNLVHWPKDGRFCQVFTGYDKKKAPIFTRWLKNCVVTTAQGKSLVPDAPKKRGGKK